MVKIDPKSIHSIIRETRIVLKCGWHQWQMTGFSTESTLFIDPCLTFISGLKSQSLASSTNHRALDLSRSQQTVAIRHRRQSPRECGVRPVAKVIVVGNSISAVGRVERFLATRKCVGLNKHLGAITSVDSIVDVEEVAVVDVARTETNGWCTRVDVVPVVVVLRDMQMAGVLVTVVVRVTDQRCLVVIVKEGVGHSDIVGGVGNLNP